MAAIDLSAIPNRGYIYTFTAATTWKEVKLPAWATKVSFTGEGTGIYVGTIGADTPVDGGAVGTHRLKVAADTLTQFFVRAEDYARAKRAVNETIAESYFVAGQSGTPDITIVVE